MPKENLGYRDAIHVPYVVVKCDQPLLPGDKVSLRGSYDDVTECVKWRGLPDGRMVDEHHMGETEPMWHAVAEPFTEKEIPAGAAFRAMLRPECFSSMRHVFRIEVHDTGGTSTCHQVCDIE